VSVGGCSLGLVAAAVLLRPFESVSLGPWMGPWLSIGAGAGHAQSGVVKAGRKGQIVGQTAPCLEAALEFGLSAARSILPSCPRQGQTARQHRKVELMVTAEAGTVITNHERVPSEDDDGAVGTKR
jgi:hypothetical protein